MRRGRLVARVLLALVVGIAVPLQAACGQAGGPRPLRDSRDELISGSFVNERTGFLLACGPDSCRVLRTDDGGRTGIRLGSLPSDTRSLVFSDLRHGIAVAQGRLRTTDDGGHHWRRTDALPEVINGVVINGVQVWVSGDGRVYRSLDGGATWMEVSTPPSAAGPFTPVAVAGARVLLVAGDGTSLAISEDGGTSWRLGDAPCRAFDQAFVAAASERGPLWLACPQQPGAGNQIKELFKSSDGGRRWHEQPELPRGGYLETMHYIRRDVLLLEGTRMAGFLRLDADGTATGVASCCAGGNGPTFLGAPDGGHVFALLDGLVKVSSDGGRTFHAP
jgi:photosystem II stability/assembly factor-like uncharacterized protein